MLHSSEIGKAKSNGRRYTLGFSAKAAETRGLPVEMGNGKRLVLRAVKTDAATGIVAGMDYALVSSAIRNGFTAEEGAVVTVDVDGMPMPALATLFTDRVA
jgi:hypothetical protein